MTIEWILRGELFFKWQAEDLTKSDEVIPTEEVDLGGWW